MSDLINYLHTQIKSDTILFNMVDIVLPQKNNSLLSSEFCKRLYQKYPNYKNCIKSHGGIKNFLIENNTISKEGINYIFSFVENEDSKKPGYILIEKNPNKKTPEIKKPNIKKFAKIESSTKKLLNILDDIDFNSKNTFKYWNDIHTKIGKQSVTSHNDFSKEYKKFYGKKFTEDSKISYDDYIIIAVTCSSASFSSDERYKIEAYEELLKGFNSFYTNYTLSKINWSKKTFDDWDNELKEEKMKDSFSQKDSKDKEMTIVEFYKEFYLRN